MMIQSSNIPMVIEFIDNMEQVDELRISLWDKTKELKLWTKDDVIINENIVKCPLTQTETKSFPEGIMELEIKWLDNGKTRHAEKIPITIDSRNDLTEMGATV